MAEIRLSTILSKIKQKCYNENDPSYHIYGEKGIKICEEWLIKSKNFFKWARENGYQDDFVLRRKDITKDFCPENCFWVSQKEGNGMRLGDRTIEWNNEEFTCSQWDEKLGFTNGTVKTRLLHNWTIEEAMTIPQFGYRDKGKLSHNSKKIRIISPDNEEKIYNSISEASKDSKISVSTLMSLIKEPNKIRRKYNNYKVSYVGDDND